MTRFYARARAPGNGSAPLRDAGQVAGLLADAVAGGGRRAAVGRGGAVVAGVAVLAASRCAMSRASSARRNSSDSRSMRTGTM